MNRRAVEGSVFGTYLNAFPIRLTSRKIHGRKPRTVMKRRVADGSHARGQSNSNQPRTALKRPVPDGGDGFGKRNIRERDAALKRALPHREARRG